MDEKQIADYFRSRECAYYHEYPVAYSGVQWKDRVIVVVGGDCGSLAVYALMRGAKFLYLYEKEEHLRKKFSEEVCKEFSMCDKVKMIAEWKGEPLIRGDVLIMDCEGCENALSVDQLKSYEQWCVAVHEWTEKKVELLSRLYGYKLRMVTPDFKEIVICNV